MKNNEKNQKTNLDPSIIKDKISILETLKENITNIIKIESQTGFDKTKNLLEGFLKLLNPFKNFETQRFP